MIFSSSFSLCLRKAFNLSLETEGKDSQGSLKSNTGIHSVSMAWDLARQGLAFWGDMDILVRVTL